MSVEIQRIINNSQLFSSVPATLAHSAPNNVEEFLKKLQNDVTENMTPAERVLSMIYHMKQAENAQNGNSQSNSQQEGGQASNSSQSQENGSDNTSENNNSEGSNSSEQSSNKSDESSDSNTSDKSNTSENNNSEKSEVNEKEDNNENSQQTEKSKQEETSSKTENSSEDNENDPWKPGTRFYGTVRHKIRTATGREKKVSSTGIFTVMEPQADDENDHARVKQRTTEKEYYVPKTDIIKKPLDPGKQELMDRLAKEDKEKEEREKEAKRKAEEEAKQFDFNTMSPEMQLQITIASGVRNVWMVGPAGCGKTTMARLAAKALNLPYYCISCGIGTSAAEFLGYKYPERVATRFADFFAKPSLIVVDEFTALDPAVAQVLNAALANGEIETTTGTVQRHPECVIVATSNTFGNGASRQYVANNQLDASTIDRFVGGIIEVNYSAEYESKYDAEVVEYVNDLRKVIATNELRRVASTRMIQAGHNMKKFYYRDWREMLIVNWSHEEKELVKHYLNTKPQEINPDGETIVRDFMINASTHAA